MTRDTALHPRFDPPCGPVIGWADGDVVRATGIPYAHAERFEPPRSAPDHADPFVAHSWAPQCPQAPVPFLERVLGVWGERPADEDCQRLSITMPAPRERAGARPDGAAGLPVMVWVHGGSYVSGAGDLSITDPALLVAQERVVVVTVTYRLGLFGFLGVEADGEHPSRPANLGLLDQLEALRWVRRNIAAFGGDPDRVTLFGQSAGGDAVAHLMTTPQAPDLFSRAIVQSAPLGIARGREAMSAAMGAVAADLNATTPVSEVIARQEAVLGAAVGHGLRAAMPFGTQYGHDPLPPAARIEAAWEAVAPRIPVLIGCTTAESALFVPRFERLQRPLSVPVVGPMVGRGLVAETTQAIYGRAARRFARRHARAGGTAYEYVIDFSPGNEWGAAHTIDLPLLFGADCPAWRRADLLAGVDRADLQRCGRGLRRIWGAFARGDDLGLSGSVPGALRYRRAS